MILVTKDTIYVLQLWRDLLVRWQTLSEIEAEVFVNICQQLKDAGLWQGASKVGGHGIEMLIRMSASDLDIAQFIYGNTAVGQLTNQSCIGSDQR